MTPATAASSPADSSVDGLAGVPTLPDVLRRLGGLEVRAARVVEGLLAGTHRSPSVGRSLEFREHREYAPGDDLRYVDWKVWGRQDRLYVKQFDEETNLRATLLVDGSASMAFRGARDAMTKHEYAATAACALAYLLAAQHDAVACRVFADRTRSETPWQTGRQQVAAIARQLEHAPAAAADEPPTDLAGAVRLTLDAAPRRSVLVLLSDLLGPLDGLAEALALARSKRVELMVLQMLSDDELDFPLEGPTRFVGLEGGAELDANPRALRAEYLAALERHQEGVAAACRRSRVRLRVARTSEPIDAVLADLLRGGSGGGDRRRTR